MQRSCRLSGLPVFEMVRVICRLTLAITLLSIDLFRFLSGEWEHRIPLVYPVHQNCGLVGAGSAKFLSEHMAMAYLDFPTAESADAGIGTRHRLHLHQR